jgi:hypothetical protein
MNYYQLIIWVDSNANDPNSSFRKKLIEESSQVQCVKTFTEIDSFLEFVQTNKSEKIFLILSGSFGEKVVPLIYDNENIYQIYLFCGSILSHSNWAMDFIDKMLMFDHEDDLLERIFKEVELYLRKQAQLYIEKANFYQNRSLSFKQESCG